MTIRDDKGNVIHELPGKQECVEILKKYLDIVVSIDPSMNKLPECYTEKQVNELYSSRNNIIEYCVVLAKQCGYKAGFAVHQPISQLLPRVQECYKPDLVHPDAMTTYKTVVEPEWDTRWGVVAYIELPTGQITWHLDNGGYVWDNHDNQQKRKRVASFIQG